MDIQLAEAVKNRKMDSGHWLYLYDNHERYIEDLLAFIETGIQAGSHIILVENDRNFLKLKYILKCENKEGLLKNIHFKNNFDFYFHNGDFHIQSIVQDFELSVQSIKDDSKYSIRTWAHVEWRDAEEIMDKIVLYEKISDKLVQEEGLLSICAYHSGRTPAAIQDKLGNCHDAIFY
ncbi:MEDS domain-containing protein [Peribacillus sp. SCS-26]|uniref:MEDS domain-containing protein n=1 Tax=Paraperibacillus marinus TaxID=3115295 RepID=UPI003905D652